MQARQPAQRRAQGCPPPALLPPPAQGGRGLRPAGACLGRPGLLPGTARLRLVAEASYSAGSTGEGWRGDPPPSPPPPKQRPSAQELALQAASVQQDLARILTDAQREEQLRRERRLERARLRRPGQLKLGNPLSSISVDQRDMDAAIAHTFPVTGDAAPSAFPTGGGPRPPRSDSQDAPARDRRRLWPLPLPRRPISTVLVVSAALLNQKNEVGAGPAARGCCAPQPACCPAHAIAPLPSAARRRCCCRSAAGATKTSEVGGRGVVACVLGSQRQRCVLRARRRTLWRRACALSQRMQVVRPAAAHSCCRARGFSRQT